MGSSNGVGTDAVPEDQRDSARSLLESVLDNVTPTENVPYCSTEFGRSGGALGFGYRRGSLLVEYHAEVNAAEAIPETNPATAELVELDDHTPLSNAGAEYAALERSALELVTDAVTGEPNPEALQPVTVWPVASEPGLYRVGYEVPTREFLYAVAFKIPPSALM